MYDNILSENQKELLPFIQSFKKEYYLVGGTAVALQIGHRESIDFDMFKLSAINTTKIAQRFNEFNLPYRLVFTDSQSFHVVCKGVKITFFQYPFKIKTNTNFEGIKMPDLLHLAAMKAYALGKRAKWKDYVDLYFILKDHHSLEEISNLSKEIYGGLFSPKLFYQQICYFKDLDYSEPVAYCGEPVADETIQSLLPNFVIKNV
jgi:hypothetical protein